MIRKFFRKVKEGLGLRGYFDNELGVLIRKRQYEHPNKFVRYGKHCFSQTDEDG